MFFVYGIGGKVSISSVDQLRQIDGVNAIVRSRVIPTIGQDGCDPDDETIDTAFAVDTPAVPLDQRHRSGLVAYAEAQKVEHISRRLRRVDELMSRDVTTVSDKSDHTYFPP